ncbi:hypothetical protein BH23BAC1_BH23BAC1_33820 [soil metagenome]
MKISHLIIILLIFLLFSSCKKEEDVRRISTKVSQPFIFDVKEGASTDIDLEEIIDASKDPTLQPFLHIIQSYRISKITYTLSDYTEKTNPMYS